jgi:hypothetical protein
MSREIQPRVIRLRDAPAYLGMDPNRFNAEVRPYLIEIPIGSQGIAFDRLDLDDWFNQYKSGNGRPGKKAQGAKLWDKEFPQGSGNVAKRGTSGNRSEVSEFEKAVEQATSRKLKNT